jgi:hypothetical protein
VQGDVPGLGDLEDRDRRRRPALSQLRQRQDGRAALLGDRDQGDSVNLVGLTEFSPPPPRAPAPGPTPP